MAEHYDCIVAGTGGVGSAALYEIARRGHSVLGIDRFPPGHDRGSSHGDTRAIRLAYHEHPDYVPLLHRAYELWDQLEQRSGRRLLFRTGMLEVGPPDGEAVGGVLAAAREHGLTVEPLSRAEIEARFSGLRVPEGMAGVLEPHGGYLAVEDCVRSHVAAAREHGAALATGEVLESWQASADFVEVRTDRGAYHAARLILTAGAWSGALVGDVGVRFEVLRKPVFWYRTETPDYRVESGFPVWLFETGGRMMYGFPEIEGGGMKIAEHTGGEVVPDPLQLDRRSRPEDRKPLEDFARAYLPGMSGDLLRHQVCMYTTSPDRHFVVDRHPGYDSVCFAAGLSGHGFKFTNVLGEALADLALDGKSELPIGFLGLSRFEPGES